MGLNSVLDIAKTALQAEQTAIHVTSHNIANVDTPGYTRQRARVSAGETVRIGGVNLGSGVQVEDVSRVYDKFLAGQILEGNGTSGKYTSLNDSLARLEGIFNDSQGSGLQDRLDAFFNSVHDVANDPADYAARTVLLSTANGLAGRMNTISQRIGSEVDSIESTVKGVVDEINTITSQIATLNSHIQSLEGGGGEASDLRDRRDQLLNDLAQRVDINAMEDASGQVTVLSAAGMSLVTQDSNLEMSVQANTDNSDYYDLFVDGRNITKEIGSGKLKGLIDARDVNYSDIKKKLGRLAASITKEFNVVHKQGYGLDSSTGNSFFTALAPTVDAKSSNVGGASSTASIQTLSDITLDEYQINFTSSSAFNISDITDGSTVSTGNSYTSGGNIDFKGLRVVITDSTGTPESGDVFTVSVIKNAARDMGIAVSDANKFAAAKSSSSLPGDNTNVMDMVALETKKSLSSGTATFYQYYSSLVSDIAVSAGDAASNSEAQAYIMDNLNASRDSISGVSIDEEGVNLLKQQHAYEAAAKVLSVVDSLLATIINLR